MLIYSGKVQMSKISLKKFRKKKTMNPEDCRTFLRYRREKNPDNPEYCIIPSKISFRGHLGDSVG